MRRDITIGKGIKFNLNTAVKNRSLPIVKASYGFQLAVEQIIPAAILMPSSLLIESYEFNFVALIFHLDYFTCIKKCRMFPLLLRLFNKFYPFP